jgi:predicted DNA-binding transcriptional regulator AlpA
MMERLDGVTCMNILSHHDLREKKGIPWSREHVRRMVKSGQFPRPFKMTPKGRNFWSEDDIDAWLELRKSTA